MRVILQVSQESKSLTSDEALLAGVQVEVVEGVVDGLDLPHLDEPHLPTHIHQ